MNQPRTLTDRDRDNLLSDMNWTIQHGRVRLIASPARDGAERRFVLANPYGSHSLLVSATDAERLNAHWQGFCAADADRAALAAAYVEKIGYDPFEDDPTIDPEVVRRTLAEYEAATEPDQTIGEALELYHRRNA